MDQLSFVLTKTGFRLDRPDYSITPNAGQWAERFQAAPYETLYALAFRERPDCFDAAGGFLCRVAERFASDLAVTPGLELSRGKTEISPSEDSVERLLHTVPFVLGSEHVNEAWLNRQYRKLRDVFREEIAAYSGTVALYFAEKSQKLHVPERIFFHLVESNDGKYPFAFLATYATKTENGKVRHVPLHYALTEFREDRAKLLELLSCLNRAAEVSPLVGGFVESGELFHPLRLTAEEAYQLLRDIPALESTGILCRIPNWWRKRANAVALTVKLGEERPAMLGLDSLLSTAPSLTVDGVPLTEEEIQQLLQQSEGLALLKGKWVEVDHGRLRELLALMKRQRGNITLLEALRGSLSGGAGKDSGERGPVVTNGVWLSQLLQSLRNPSKLRKAALPESFRGSLRPYQKNGLSWLWQMDQLGFGACLADDMGLGKTVQILAYLETIRKKNPDAKALLIVPASLLGNWQKEAQRFAPEMCLELLHGASAAALRDRFAASNAFLTVTTYRMVLSLETLQEQNWDCVILDEAQAIKNPAAKQTREIKKLHSRMRIAMTGTPIENDLTNLWSLFDFLNKGLLGSSEEFRSFCRGLEEKPEGYARLRNMISPFLLRRVKTDKRIISDLPEKLEQTDYVELSAKQTVLYRKLLAQTQERLLNSEGIERKGLVLALLLHLKQICNHPDQYLGQPEYDPGQSGKFEMLRQIAETIYEKRERVLVFTQFRELTGALDDYLAAIFHCRGGVIHGGVSAKGRTELVERFQSEDYMPYLVLSVKAGGTGLNLTNANHVIHFDRWWNPSVENQATDRAFRIGQQKNVMVHKFVCRGSVEEKIDALISSKRELAENVIGSGGEHWITELSNEELLSVLRLDA
ncbi:MAG: DEAD/DEAH box helicase [Oscillospiraceae bacterium]|nr:DEAD/DEAH box helicase [Oscillospiraceae bacterium]